MFVALAGEFGIEELLLVLVALVAGLPLVVVLLAS